MNVVELVERLGGEMILNRAVVMRNGVQVVIGVVDGSNWVRTAEGDIIAAEESNIVVAEEPKPVVRAPRRTRQAAALPVESVEVVLPEPDDHDIDLS
jgi:hypothetical protein